MTFEYEEAVRAQGYVLVGGVDEAGRGPLCGNVVAACVILPVGYCPDGLNDSKKLSPKKRDLLYDVIIENAVSYGIGQATPQEIDEYNILNATMLAMHRAIEAMPQKPDFALIDGNCARGFSLPVKTVIKGDALVPCISAASILAKVTRDRECLELDREYPEYGFAKHKGYGTKQHMDALRAYGPCPCHRKSFLSFLERTE